MIQIRVKPGVRVSVGKEWRDISGQLIIELDGGSLERANLSGKCLDHAYLMGADLRRGTFRSARLCGACLDHANLEATDLTQAHLEGASLRHTRLCNANLNGAILTGASLQGADLSGAILTDAYLQFAEFDDNTIWPYGFDPLLVGAEHLDEMIAIETESRHARTCPPRQIRVSLAEHPNRCHLMSIRRKLIGRCAPESITYNGFVADAIPEYAVSGERIWARYAIGAECCPAWWQATITDSAVEVAGSEVDGYRLPFAEICKIELPTLRATALRGECGGETFRYHAAIAVIRSGERFELFAIDDGEHYRDVDLWHCLV